MLGTKLAERIAIAAISAALAVSLLLCIFSGTVFAVADGGVSMQYETKMFDHDSIMTVDILMDEDDWQDMLDNAAAEEYSKCDVVVNGTTFYSAAIRPKGNTSLSSIVNDPTTDRYSFKLEFDHYIDGQTCFGLDKLILNNNYADATNMKEAIAYDMFAYLGAYCSLYNLVRTDPNAFYIYDEYDEAAEMLVQVVELRAESVTGQLDGTIPSTDSAQASSDALIDTSGVDISIMGGMGGGRGGEQKENGAPGNGNARFDGFPGEPPEGMQAPQGGDGQTPPERPETFTDGSTVSSQDSAPDSLPQDEKTSSVSEVTENSGTALSDSDENTQQISEENSASSEASDQNQNRGDFRPGGFSGGQQGLPGGQSNTESSGTPAGLVSLLVSAGVIAAGLVFAFLFKANRR